MAKIAYDDKESLRESSLPAKNVVRAEDLNEIKSSVNTLHDTVDGKVEKAEEASGVVISFDKAKVYEDYYTPASGNITDDLTGAQLGVVQKIYHEDGSEPTVPAGWVLLGSGTYDTAALNIIYAEWAGESRVEYWIVQ